MLNYAQPLRLVQRLADHHTRNEYYEYYVSTWYHEEQLGNDPSSCPALLYFVNIYSGVHFTIQADSHGSPLERPLRRIRHSKTCSKSTSNVAINPP